MKKCWIESDVCFEYVFNLVILIDSVKKNWFEKRQFGTIAKTFSTVKYDFYGLNWHYVIHYNDI